MPVVWVQTAMEWIKISTKAKMNLACHLSRLVRAFITVSGQDSHAVVARRQSIRWQLDLRECIDLSLYLFGSFENQTTKKIKSLLQPGDIYIDIGANVRALALHAATITGESGQVVAIEPTDWAFSKLQKNISLNKELSPHIEAIKAFIADPKTPVPESVCSSWNLEETPSNQFDCGIKKPIRSADKISLDQWQSDMNRTKSGSLKLLWMDTKTMFCKAEVNF